MLSSQGRVPKGGLLALDWGQKKVGFATVDELAIVVTPRGNFKRKGFNPWGLTTEDKIEIKKLIESFEPGALVLGYPLNADGSEGEAALGSKRLAAELTKEFGFEVFLVNETLTSWDSKNAPDEDAQAAALLLEDFIRSRK